jgi:DNA-binding XRE family transcriptional regulator
MENLRKRRDAAGLSRFELAKLAGISPDTIEALEKGRSEGNVQTARKLARALGTTVDDLIGGKAKRAE